MITQDKITQIVDTVVQVIHPEKIILFGSYADGTANKNSDLDILVIVKHNDKPGYKRAGEIRKHLWDITDISEDILVYTEKEVYEWKNVKQAFITDIVAKGKVVYEKRKGSN